jgi:hypothetical protein
LTEASSDEEEQYEALEALRTPDPRTLRFTPMGLALGHTMQPEASARFLHSLVAVPVSRKVDTEVARTLKRVRTVFLHGLFDYELFTAAQDLAFLGLEGMLRRRFMVAYDGSLPFVKNGAREALAIRTFDDVRRAVRRRARAGWRLGGINVAQHADFNAGTSALTQWARREGWLSGQRNRAIEAALVALRNFAAHPEQYSLTHPVEASRAIRDTAEIANRL